MLEKSEIALMRKTPLIMLDRKTLAAEVFYQTLFEMSPHLRDLFPEQMGDQARKFAATLIVAINALSDWDGLRPVIEALARRHLGYGVKKEHYDEVGEALLATLRKFDAQPDELAIWARVYRKLADHMTDIAYPSATTG